MYVVATGSPFDGLTVYGPFASNDEAVEWAKCNLVTDLSDVPWWVVPLERTTEEGEEDEEEEQHGA